MSATYPTKLVLAAKSGGICAYPGCGRYLTHESASGEHVYVGEAAHICGEKPGSARYDQSMTEIARNSVGNLIYLCTDHHTIIDKVESDWPADKLQELKEKHETKICQASEKAVAEVAFPELENAVKWVTNQAPASGGTFHLISPDKKITKNALSNGTRHIIAGALASRATVAAFVAAETQLDPDFPDRLKAGFCEHYFSWQKQGYKGDELFDLMCAVAQQGMCQQADRSAGVAVLVYLFEICDVFEK